MPTDLSPYRLKMKGFLVLLGTSAMGWVAWRLCSEWGLMVQYTVSVIASGVGYYYTKKFVENLLGL